MAHRHTHGRPKHRHRRLARRDCGEHGAHEKFSSGVVHGGGARIQTVDGVPPPLHERELQLVRGSAASISAAIRLWHWRTVARLRSERRKPPTTPNRIRDCDVAKATVAKEACAGQQNNLKRSPALHLAFVRTHPELQSDHEIEHTTPPPLTTHIVLHTVPFQ